MLQVYIFFYSHTQCPPPPSPHRWVLLTKGAAADGWVSHTKGAAGNGWVSLTKGSSIIWQDWVALLSQLLCPNQNWQSNSLQYYFKRKALKKPTIVAADDGP